MASTTVQGVWVGKSQFDDAEKKFHSKVSAPPQAGVFILGCPDYLSSHLNLFIDWTACPLNGPCLSLNNHFSPADAATLGYATIHRAMSRTRQRSITPL